MRGHRRGFTIIEVVVATVVSGLVITMAWQFFSSIMGRRSSSAIALTADSFLRQEAVDGIQSLTRRLQESIQVLSPLPGQSADTINFRDIINNPIHVEVKANTLVASGPGGEEKAPVPLEGSNPPFYPTKPIRVPGCIQVQFSSLTPTCVVMRLTFSGDNNSKTTLVNTVELQNAELAR